MYSSSQETSESERTLAWVRQTAPRRRFTTGLGWVKFVYRPRTLDCISLAGCLINLLCARILRCYSLLPAYIEGTALEQGAIHAGSPPLILHDSISLSTGVWGQFNGLFSRRCLHMCIALLSFFHAKGFMSDNVYWSAYSLSRSRVKHQSLERGLFLMT